MTDLDSETFAEIDQALQCIIKEKEPTINVKTKKNRGRPRKIKNETSISKKTKTNRCDYSLHKLKLKAEVEQQRELIVKSLNKLIQYFDELEFDDGGINI